jgi:Zn-dependent protease with chaperone function
MGLKTRMAIALALLFGLLFALLMGFTYFLFYIGVLDGIWIIAIPLIFTILIVIAQWAIGPYIIKWIFKIKWVSSYGKRIDHYIYMTCARYGIQKPKLGIILDHNPNAFCFGWTRNKSFLVITEGIIKYCDEEEQKAVVAHEVGHIAHNDFVVMTVVAAIPLIFYVIFRGAITFIRYGGKGGGKGKGQAVLAALVVALISYMVYILSHFIALLISRYREYWADDFSAETTMQPNKLSSALVKIAYGLAIEGRGMESEKKHRRYENTFMIFNAKGARALAAKASDYRGNVDKENIKKAMAWDLWSPWAFFLELQSTHPLPAKRIKALDDNAKSRGMKTYIDFDLKKTESYWDDFLADIFMASLWLFAIPIAIFTAIYFNILVGLGAFIFFVGLFVLIYFISYKYPFAFKDAKVNALIGDLKASPIKGRPVKLRGRIIGRGIPGLFFSEDLKLDDGTGLMLLDYHQISRFIDFLVGIFATEEKIGEQVEVWGWYRRRIVPYVELYRMRVRGRWKKIYTQKMYFVLLGIVMFIGAFIMAVASGLIL